MIDRVRVTTNGSMPRILGNHFSLDGHHYATFIMVTARTILSYSGCVLWNQW
jgi:hypothetical protein